jgi:prolipoprotein diacylglyceryltransferase
VPWATVFPAQCSAGKVFAGVAIHPTQLYASLAHFAILALLLVVGNRRPRPGTVIGLFLVLHAAVRLGVEAVRYRAPSALETSFVGIALFPSRLFCLGLLALGGYVLLRRSALRR